MVPAVEIKELMKTYSNGFKALKGVNLEVKKGDFFGLLGPNGAGKSTMIGILTDLITKTSGNVKIFGHDIDKNLSQAKEFIGVVPQEFNFGIFEKVIDIVVNQAGYYGLLRNVALERAEKYLKKLDLWDKKDNAAMTLSGGMKRRLMIARALIHEPKLLILDEPTAGVDIELRKGMWEFVKDLNKKGITIILTTHYLEEAESLCKNIAIINHGKVITNMTTKKLLSTLSKETFVLDLNKSIKKIPKSEGYDISKIDDFTLEVTISKEDNLNKLFSYFNKEGIEVVSMKNKTNRLEELFLGLIGGEK